MRFFATIAVFCVPSFAAFAAEKPAAAKVETAMPAPTTEQRETMAKNHEQMAACLRSDKAIDVCHKEMMSSCEQSGAACPMMRHHMGQGHGMMKGKGPAATGK